MRATLFQLYLQAKQSKERSDGTKKCSLFDGHLEGNWEPGDATQICKCIKRLHSRQLMCPAAVLKALLDPDSLAAKLTLFRPFWTVKL